MTAASRVVGFLTPARDSDTPDAELVRRFVTSRDEHSFAALVRRHGPMVWGVCRRIVRDEHLAEDAFQAAFVVLARRAAAISPPGAVAGWLHGIAFRVAKDARRSALRRSSRERTAVELPETAAPSSDPHCDNELRTVLDSELRMMPAKYREPLVACDLEGRPRQPVAEALGIPEGTLSSRLTAARRILADRLARRGVATAVAVVMATTGPAAEACEVPRELLTSTVRFGSDAVGTVPAGVAALADGAIRAMTTAKKLLIAGIAVAAIAVCAIGTAATSNFFADPPPTKPEAPEPPKVALPAPNGEKPMPTGPNRILFVRDGKLVAVDPNGKNEKEVGRERGLNVRPSEVRLSPDGKRVAVLIKIELPNDPLPDDLPRFRLYVRGLDEKEPGTDTGIECMTFAWSGDGTEIAYTGFGKPTPDEKGLPIAHGILTVATKKTVALKMPDGHILIDWSRDGKYFVALRVEERKPPTMSLVNRDGTEHKKLTDGKSVISNARLSPDGKKLLFICVNQEKGRKQDIPDSVGTIEVRVMDIESGKSHRVAVIPRGDWPTGLGLPSGLCWSPDGKQVAYAWRHITKVGEKDPEGTESEVALVVCDTDGKNPTTLATWKVKGQQQDNWLNTVDWR